MAAVGRDPPDERLGPDTTCALTPTDVRSPTIDHDMDALRGLRDVDYGQHSALPVYGGK
ncbi:hypothetical protein ACH4D3_12465 [Streptomyces sp. NPDC018026]|uniref:hypothetical protein n=1 Tax=Streptomyces sp. NPDC018026 TaxID=3365031 RepID=UPI0037A3BCDA